MASATKGAKVTTLNNNISNLATAATQWADQENSGSYEGISLKKLEEDSVIGNDWGEKGKSKNPFAGGITIQSAFNNNGFVITAENLPNKICKKYNDKKYKIPAADDWECTSGTLKAYYGGTKDEAGK